jgi:hypothetical protein
MQAGEARWPVATSEGHMTQVTLELDDETLARVADVARARRMSVEDFLRKHAEDVARLGPIAIDNPSHRTILAALDRPAGTSREEAHDRERQRAQGYVDHRRRLLDLIDGTQGDLGEQAIERQRLHDR